MGTGVQYVSLQGLVVAYSYDEIPGDLRTKLMPGAVVHLDGQRTETFKKSYSFFYTKKNTRILYLYMIVYITPLLRVYATL